MKYFSFEELCKSATATRKGIDNRPTTVVTANLTALVSNILDPLREAWGAPIIVSSGYRCPKLNRAVGGASRSQHTKGQAYEDDIPETLIIEGNTGKCTVRLLCKRNGAGKLLSAKIVNNALTSYDNIPNQIKCDFDEIHFIGNICVDATRLGCLWIGGTSSATKLLVKDSTFESNVNNNYYIQLGGGNVSTYGADFIADEIRIENCVFKGDNPKPRIGQNDNTGIAVLERLIIKECRFYLDGNNAIWALMLFGSTSNEKRICQNLFIEDNYYEKETSGNYFTGYCVNAYIGRNKYISHPNGDLQHQNLNALYIAPMRSFSGYKAEYGDSSSRPALNFEDEGYIYYDESLKKRITATFSTTQIKYISLISSTPLFAANTLTKGQTVLFKGGKSRNGTVKVYFSKVNSNPSESDLIEVFDTLIYGKDIRKTIVAPDPTVYPYIYGLTSSNSWVLLYLYSITQKWIEDDGAAAGVARSGATADRPASADIYAGFQYFDTTLGRPVWWSGSDWVDLGA